MLAIPQFFRLAACLCALPLVSGCVIPYPHRTVRSHEVRGTVLNARTHAPIKGAKVVQSGYGTGAKAREATTDASGRFVLPKCYNFHWARGVEGDVPFRCFFDKVVISYPDYLAYEIDGLIEGEFKVLLEPVESLEVSGKVLDARTMAPIEGARVYFGEYPPADCKSDATGHFRLKATPDFYRQYRAAARSERPFQDQVVITHPKYRARGFHCAEAGDMTLVPQDSP